MAKNKAREVRKSLGLKFDDVKFMTTNRFESGYKNQSVTKVGGLRNRLTTNQAKMDAFVLLQALEQAIQQTLIKDQLHQASFQHHQSCGVSYQWLLLVNSLS